MTASTIRYLQQAWLDEEEDTPRVDKEEDIPKVIDENQRPALRQAAQVSGRPARILVADDDSEMRKLLATSLRNDGYEVEEATDGRELLEAFSLMLFSGLPVPIDVVVSDERMPGFLGSEVLVGLREADWPTPFFLITGFGGREVHEQARRMGATAVFDKPFDLERLKEAIVEVLSARNGERLEHRKVASSTGEWERFESLN